VTTGGAVGTARGAAEGAGGATHGAAMAAARCRNLEGTARAGRGATGGSKPEGISDAGRRVAEVEVPAVVMWVPMVKTVGSSSQKI
jgi:hypothetical protein